MRVTLLTVFLIFAADATRAQAAGPVLTTLLSFNGSNGSGPQATVVIGSGGVLYGTAYAGGNRGLVYSLSPPSGSGGAWTETILHAFGGVPSDGANPEANLVIGTGGVLYGTTDLGGTSNQGMVFALTPPSVAGGSWTEAVLHNFAGGNDGFFPTGGVVVDANGVLYGTTYRGGASGNGIAYSLTPPSVSGGAWTETVLHNFTGGSDGGGPESGVVIGGGGVLYGATDNGGTAGLGVAFSLTPPASPGGTWTETVLYNFMGGSDGSTASAGVIVGPGVLYGTTIKGGSANVGTVYSLAPPASGSGPWTETILHTFTGSDGASPSPGVVIGRGTGGQMVLYGSTDYGGSMSHGAVYSLTPSSSGGWTETVLYNFTDGSDGATPAGGVVVGRGAAGAVLYGTTRVGGSGGHGTVFSLTP